MQMIIARGGIEPPYVAVKERCRNRLANAHYIRQGEDLHFT